MSGGQGATIFGLDGLGLTADEAAFFRAADPFGFILFARNIDTPAQLSRLTASLRDCVGWEAPIFIDQEGGRVQRMRAPYWSEWLPPRDAVERAGAGAARMSWLRARLIAAELRAVGIDGNCAPCLDIATAVTHPFLANRCFGSDLATVVEMGRASAEGHLAGGVLPVVKHIPGHGRANADTHHDLPTVRAAAADLQSQDFAAFRALNDLPLGMTAHIVFEAFDSAPATCSAPMIRLIREEIGFGGLLMTDDLNMEALSGTLAERTAQAMAAGCDIALHCKGVLAQMEEVATAAGRLTPQAATRATAALAARHPPEAADLAALRAEHDGLLGLTHV
ncbi:beta-N-acetylhexosaminidase [Gemmobacter aquatilis]|uniref:beta-N-acetylhexosaminidase n=1 Tax=Gemmobacter aquatilis TaxID=933059 RepID=A0A1H8BCY5_9RHOB|nr:glycoside hydrolase family 3 N-terminal domain-containing protein [Gemmobacter aquatilis]SEM80821.1 beta-N-acetylhexosaminidase [Gemmobacter aquatilis]